MYLRQTLINDDFQMAILPNQNGVLWLQISFDLSISLNDKLRNGNFDKFMTDQPSTP